MGLNDKEPAAQADRRSANLFERHGAKVTLGHCTEWFLVSVGLDPHRPTHRFEQKKSAIPGPRSKRVPRQGQIIESL